MKTIYFDTIERILENEDNDTQHLEALQVMVSLYLDMFGECENSDELKKKYKQLENKLDEKN